MLKNPRDAAGRVLCPICNAPILAESLQAGRFAYHRECWRPTEDERRAMTPPRRVDEHGRELPTRPCPKCHRVIPANRWPAKAGAIQRRPYQMLSFVEWCLYTVEVAKS